MDTVTQSPGSDPAPLPPPGAAPYFRALPAPDWAAIDAVLAEMGLPPAA